MTKRILFSYFIKFFARDISSRHIKLLEQINDQANDLIESSGRQMLGNGV